MKSLLLAIRWVIPAILWIAGCNGGNFKTPVAVDATYKFPGATNLIPNDDGTYLLTWPSPLVEKPRFNVYKRTTPEAFNFKKPEKVTDANEQSYLTDYLRFEPKTCFVVRFFIDGFNEDTNINEVCTKEFDYKFGGLEVVSPDEKNIWTLSWKAAPFKRASYRVYEVDPNGSLMSSSPRDVTETSTRFGPFAVGVVKCYVVRLLIDGKTDGDANTITKCTEGNRIGRFVGIERATSDATGEVRLQWTPADNESVVAYLIYKGTSFQQLVTKVDLRQSSSYVLKNLTPGVMETFGVRALARDGSEDPNTRTIGLEVKDLRPLPFLGLQNATVSGKGEVTVSWIPIDGVSEYRLYSASGRIDSRPVPDTSKPLLTISDPKKAEWRVQSLGDETEHVFLLRAVSRFGVEELNYNLKYAVIPDQGAPVFRGIKSATNMIDGKVKLSWDPALGYVKQYKIFRALGSGGVLDFSQTDIPVELGTSSSSIIGGFQANQSYTFAVRAEDDRNQDSNTATVTLVVGQQSLPTFSGYVGASALGERSIRINFNVTRDANVKQYRVRSRVLGTNNWLTNDVVPQDLIRSVLSWTIGSEDESSPLRAKTTYEILVTAVDAWNNESNNNVNYQIATLDLTPPSFDGLMSVEQTPGTSELKLNWLPRRTTDIEKYIVYWAKTPIDGTQLNATSALPTGVQKTALIDGSAISYPMMNLEKGKTYYFVVHALDVFGNEDKNTLQVSSVILNSFPSLVADGIGIRTPEREPGVLVNLTATDINQSDALTIVMASTTCPADMNLPQLIVAPQTGGARKAQVSWTPSQGFIQAGVSERSCIATYTSFDGESNSPVVALTLTAYNREPRNVTATIAPMVGGYKRSQTLTCGGSAVDDDGNPLVYDYQWIKNGTAMSGATSPTLTPAVAVYAPNDKVICRVGVSDSHARIEAMSSEIVMGNSAPVISTFTIAEDGGVAPLNVGDQAVCTLSISDADGDTITTGAMSIESSLDGVNNWAAETLAQTSCYIGGSRKTCFSVTPVVRRKFIRCRVENFSDGFAPLLTPSFSTNSVEIKNSTPVVTGVTITPTAAFEVGSTLTCNADVTDADQDALQIAPSFRWTRDGIAIDGAFSNSYTVARADRNAALRCEATLVANADGFGSTTVGPIRSASRTYANSVPQIQSVQVTPGGDAATKDILTCAAAVFDPDGDVVNTEPPVGLYTWIANDGIGDTMILGQMNKTLIITQDLRKKKLKCSYSLGANSDSRGAPAVAAVVSVNNVFVNNTNPTLTDVFISAAATPVVTGTILTCNKTIADLDGDAFNDLPRYKWFSDGAAISGATQDKFTARARDRGKKITCSVELAANFDGQGSTAVWPVVSSNFFTPINSQPVISGVIITSISLEPYYPGVTLSCDIGTIGDPDGDSVVPLYKWFNGATELPDVTTQTYSVTSADRGSKLKCAAVLDANADGWQSVPQTILSTNTAAIQNRAPSSFVPLLSTVGGGAAYRSSTVKCTLPSAPFIFDADGDSVTYRYRWLKGGAYFPGTSAAGTAEDWLVLATDPGNAPGQQISCEVVVSDGIASTTSSRSSALTISNLGPTTALGTKTQISPSPSFASSRPGYGTLTCSGADFVDPDGDSFTVTYSFKRRIGGGSGTLVNLSTGFTSSSTFTASGTLEWKRGDDVWCEAQAQDSFGALASPSLTEGNSGVVKVSIANTKPKASYIKCNGGEPLIQKFLNETFNTPSCETDFTDGDAETPTFEITSPPPQACASLNSKILFNTINGTLSGVMPAETCQVIIAMKDGQGAYAVNANDEVVKTVIQFSPAFFASFGRASLDSQCRVNFETQFSPASLTFGSSTFSFSALVGGPQQHTGADTQNGVMTGTVNPSSGGGVVEARWNVLGSNPAFVQNLKKTVQIDDSPAVNGVPTEPVPMPGVQVTPAPDTSGLRATGCALADCTGRPGSIAAGLTQSCAVANDGKLFCWGENNLGELGIGSFTTPTNIGPVQVSLPANHRAKSVAASGLISLGVSHTCAILEESVSGNWLHRGLYCWGDNQYGQLGRGNVFEPAPANLAQASPAGVDGLSGSTGSEIYAVAAGGAHTCVILKPSSNISGGAVRCWGYNSRGQLGDGTLQTAASPGVVIGFSSAGALGIAAGGEHNCVVTNVGTVQCWGNNDKLQLGVQWGSNNVQYNVSPVTVPNLTGVVSVAAGEKHTCALLNNGVVKCWGSNQSGQLGDGNLGNVSDLPLPLVGSVITGNQRAVAIAAGGNTTCALLENGGVKCWGANTSGQIGDGTQNQALLPTDVLDLSYRALAVEVGNGQTCILKNNGGVSCYGSPYPAGLPIPQKKPTNNVMPQPLLSPAIPAAQFRNCRVLRSIEQ